MSTTPKQPASNRFVVKKETIRELSIEDLDQVNGGAACCSAGTCGSYYDCDAPTQQADNGGWGGDNGGWGNGGDYADSGGGGDWGGGGGDWGGGSDYG